MCIFILFNSPLSLNHSCLLLRFIRDFFFFYVPSVLNRRRPMDLMVCLLLSLKNLCFITETLLGKALLSPLVIIYLPSCWKYAVMNPVPKTGDRSNPSKYYPITLIFLMSLAFESFLCLKFLNLLSPSDLLSDWQHGFCSGIVALLLCSLTLGNPFR